MQRSRLFAFHELNERVARERQLSSAGEHSGYASASMLLPTSGFARRFSGMPAMSRTQSGGSAVSALSGTAPGSNYPGDLSTSDMVASARLRSLSSGDASVMPPTSRIGDLSTTHPAMASLATGNAKILQPGSGDSLLDRLSKPVQGDTSYRAPHFMERSIVPLASDEDQNWLSEMLCFVRKDVVEIFRAQEMDIRSRNSSKRIQLGQIGIRCRYCAHLPKGSRAGRSASFPSSLDRIYQSLTMMLRDHFGKCKAMPLAVQDKFLRLKRKTTQGATDSKLFWVHSAEKMGLEDSEDGGIRIKDEHDSKDGHGGDGSSSEAAEATTRNLKMAAASAPKDPQAKALDSVSDSPQHAGLGARRRPSLSSGSSSASSHHGSCSGIRDTSSSKKDGAEEKAEEASSAAFVPRAQDAEGKSEPVRLLFPEDRDIVSPYLYCLLSQLALVHLEESERVGNRKSLPAGLPGLCCRHCDESGRKGMCRVFPARRRNLSSKVFDLHDHFTKCNLCPQATKEELQQLKEIEARQDIKSKREERGFFGELWTRMGHHGQS
ncbi:MAG: hypothetical protein SGILL_008379 [Bacillariaceae sp.]